MAAAWKQLPTAVSNVTAANSKGADRQKIQMKALFLPGREKELMRECSGRKLLTFDIWATVLQLKVRLGLLYGQD